MKNGNAVTNLSADRGAGGKFAKGNKPKNGFDKRPQDRSSGSWKKEQTARFILEQMIRKTKPELEEILADPVASAFQQTIANILLDKTNDSYKKWRVMEGMINQIYGSPVQAVVTDEPAKKPFILGFAMNGRQTSYV